jgi:hypothetical protein
MNLLFLANILGGNVHVLSPGQSCPLPGQVLIFEIFDHRAQKVPFFKAIRGAYTGDLIGKRTPTDQSKLSHAIKKGASHVANSKR